MYRLLLALSLFPLVATAQSASLKSPNISANALFLYRNSNFHGENVDTVRNGLDVQEAELAAYSDVDPYSRLIMILSVHPEYTAGTDSVTEKWVLEPEELFAESEHVPGLTLKLGKFYAAFGKHNTLHTHVFPFVEAPLANSVLLGDGGLNDAGVSAAGLLPTPWYSEVTVQYLRGEGENDEFNSPTPSDGVILGHWKNLVDLTDSATLEAGASYAHGGNQIGGNTTLTGGDLTFKWRPTNGGKYQSAILAAEYIGREMEQTASARERGVGLVYWGKYQFAERWSALARYETLDMKNSTTLPNILTEKKSAEIQFDATEFSSFRLEYDYAHGPVNTHGQNNEQQILLQANFTIGAHPAHAY